MPIISTKDDSKEITEHVATGVIHDEEMFACQEEFYETGPTRLELWEMSASDLTQITIGGMQKFINRAAHLGKSRQGGRSAVITRTSLQYGLGRVAEALGEFESLPFTLRIFRERGEAVEWLKNTKQ